MSADQALQDFIIEWGPFFRVRETVKATSESDLEKQLMATRPEIFPVNIQRVRTWEELGGQLSGVAA